MLAEYGMGACVQGNYHHSACILIKPVDYARPGNIALVGHLVDERLSVSVSQRIDDCPVHVASSRVHNHSLRLIYDKHVLVFIQHRKRDILRLDLLKHVCNIVKLNSVPFTHLVTLLGSLSID